MSPEAERKMAVMLLYAPLGDDEADRAAKGLGFAEQYYFVDRPALEEAQDDAVWVVIDAPEDEVIAFEEWVDPALGYRQFILQAEIASRFPAWLADPRGTVSISREDARIASQALNEVLHGPDAIEEWEFGLRMGTSREAAKELLERLGRLYTRR
jgi:hypothetical protein